MQDSQPDSLKVALNRPAVLFQLMAKACAGFGSCKLKGQAVQPQRASRASLGGKLCTPERHMMQAKPYLRFVLEVERLLFFRGLRCCAGGCPLALLIRPILDACTTRMPSVAGLNCMHACSLTKADCWLVANTRQQDMFVTVCVAYGGLCSVVAAEPCDVSCDGADAPL